MHVSRERNVAMQAAIEVGGRLDNTVSPTWFIAPPANANAMPNKNKPSPAR